MLTIKGIYMVTHKFNHQNEILETKFFGEVTLREIIDYIESTRLNKLLPRKLKIRTDATDANFVFSVGDLDKIIKANNRSLEEYQSIIDGIIVAGTLNTALSILYQRLGYNPKYRFNVFSTAEAADEWLRNY